MPRAPSDDRFTSERGLSLVLPLLRYAAQISVKLRLLDALTSRVGLSSRVDFGKVRGSDLRCSGTIDRDQEPHTPHVIGLSAAWRAQESLDRRMTG